MGKILVEGAEELYIRLLTLLDTSEGDVLLGEVQVADPPTCIQPLLGLTCPTESLAHQLRC